jgi:hypothetical protein
MKLEHIKHILNQGHQKVEVYLTGQEHCVYRGSIKLYNDEVLILLTRNSSLPSYINIVHIVGIKVLIGDRYY